MREPQPLEESAPRTRRDPAGLVAAVGCLHALLFLGAYELLGSTPRAGAPDEELVAFYGSEDRRRLVLVGLYVMPFAGISFLWFATALRGWLRSGARHASELLWGLHLASGLLYVALFFVGAAAHSVVAVSVEHASAPLDPMLARQFPQFGSALLGVFGMRMAAMFVFTTSRLGRLAGVVPGWFATVGVGVGLVLLFSITLSRVLVLVFPLWLLVLCALLLRARTTSHAAGG